MNLLPGSPHPLGATADGAGVNFAIYSENATKIELCLFEEDGRETTIEMPGHTAHVWHAYAPDVPIGQRYGFRVHGPYEPDRGFRFNPKVVVLDPYARAVDGVERWDAGCFAYVPGEDDHHRNEAPQLGAQRGVVIDNTFDWEGDARPQTPLHRSVIYEAHVRGLTKLHPEIPVELRGTYAGVAHPAMIAHLRELGITAIELMPVHCFVDDKILLDKGLRNYWGYNTVNFFAPDVRYRSRTKPGSEVDEFKRMVKTLHRAGIEVILDVVYNHTAEGNHLGPTFNLKGIDNTTYYRLVPNEPRYYFDYTGTGNTLNVQHPQVLALIMDSLRYWAAEMHVDGFRFDLASALARSLHEVDKLSSFFSLIHQSPTLREVKLIAEPWDVGEGGYQVGNFPVRWAEWNGRYRDAIRRLWQKHGQNDGEIGYRLSGSSDLYEANGRRPSASINLIAAHDGFTLSDLVTYEHKRNDANGEGNRDGNDDEHSWNGGVEGESDDENLRTLRNRQRRNLLATLLLSQGTPMIVAGDEFGRTQKGNNNAYCQDNEISWLNWNWSPEQEKLYAFVKKLLRIRREHPVLHRTKFFQGQDIFGTALRDLAWFRSDGTPWRDPGDSSSNVFGMFLAGRGVDDTDDRGRPLVDDNFLLLLNASDENRTFTIPNLGTVHESWQLLVDTSDDSAEEARSGGKTTDLVARSLKFFRAPSRVVRTGGVTHTLNATYRLQFNKDFGFVAAKNIVDYLADLGVTDVYASPLMAAAEGSTHGYDVVDHSRLNDDLGTYEQFIELSESLRSKYLGLLLDWVPNHMGIASSRNKWWADVLENGPSSLYAEHFDIDFHPVKPDLQNRVLLPVLGDSYGDTLERGEIKVVWHETQGLEVAYLDQRFPVAPKTTIPLLEKVLAESGLAEGSPRRQELESIVSSIRHLPLPSEIAPEQRKERAREENVVKRRLAALVVAEPDVARTLVAAIDELNGKIGVLASFDALDSFLRDQNYRLASWRVAVEEINYRRFFDVNALAAIRMENDAVFDESHRLLFDLLAEDRVQALRLDHTDGLYDPRAYFDKLQNKFANRAPKRVSEASPDDVARPLPLLAEKILEPGERLPSTWLIDGTTGYDFAAAVTGLWIDPSAEAALTNFYRQFTGDEKTFATHLLESKRYILAYSLGSEVNMLARSLERIASMNRKWRDFTLVSLTRALTHIISALEVYRTYVRFGEPITEDEIMITTHAVARAQHRDLATSPAVYDFLRDVLLLQVEGSAVAHAAFGLRLQQLTGAVMAKASEDTAFYRYNRLICLNDVGSSPAKFGTTADELHEQNADRARSWPLAMTTTSTHDSKRGEDAAARIAVISEVLEPWQKYVGEWHELLQPATSRVDGETAPTANHEYLFFQTLVGTWPFGWNGSDGREDFCERLQLVMLKASKEAKQQTSWTNPNEPYDAALRDFITQALASERFMESMRRFCDDIAIPAAVNGIAQALIKLCSPGIPDIYQGAELWHQALVDPDNRRPVRFDERRKLLERIESANDKKKLCADLLGDIGSGGIKLHVTHAALMARGEHAELFRRGDYESISGGDHVFAFTRGFEKDRLLCVVPRRVAGAAKKKGDWPIGDAWGDARLPFLHRGTYRNVMTGAAIESAVEIKLSEAFSDFPVALFISER
jgi:glycogen operon protein